jgi:hypothetical protein
VARWKESEADSLRQHHGRGYESQSLIAVRVIHGNYCLGVAHTPVLVAFEEDHRWILGEVHGTACLAWMEARKTDVVVHN